MSSQDLPLDRPDHDDTAADSAAGESLSFDTSVAHPARIYNYWLGGKDNYQAGAPRRSTRGWVRPG